MNARLLIVVLLWGCWSDDSGSDEAAQARRRVAGPAPTAEPGQAPKPPNEPRTPATRPTFDPRPPAQPEAVEAAPEPAKDRDYGAELKAGMGSPISCLKPRLRTDKTPDKITISLTASVMGSGGVSRGEVRSSVLGPTEIDCIRRRLEQQRLAPPIDDAPRRVTASIELVLQKKDPTPAGATPAPTPEPVPTPEPSAY